MNHFPALSLNPVGPQRARLGECLQWHGASRHWWWTDIESACLHAWAPGAEAARRYALPDRAGCFAHTRSGRLLLGLAKRLCFGEFTPPELPVAGGTANTGELQLQPLCPVDAQEPRTRINDGRTDRSGNFVFGTINEASPRRPIASFFQFSMRHGLRRLALPSVAIANSLCFSLDGRTLYFCDSTQPQILACDYDAATASVARLRVFATLDDAAAAPDGSVIDAEDCLWNAQWGSGRVQRHAPDGRVIARYHATALQLTCPALGGPGLDELMVSSAFDGLTQEEIDAQADCGGLFGLRLPTALGVPEVLFDDHPPH